jgi:mono/diheme cytochrome c family protein
MRAWIGVLAAFAAGCGEESDVEHLELEVRASDERVGDILALDGDPVAGAVVYRESCATCHRASGLGVDDPVNPGLGANLTLVIEHPEDDPRYVRMILIGPGVMPSFAGLLDDRQIADVLAYVHEDLFD